MKFYFLVKLLLTYLVTTISMTCTESYRLTQGGTLCVPANIATTNASELIANKHFLTTVITK